MESDSSLENEESQQGRREWANVPAQNSDVSDDENFSRGAKSIESPPESPWCGANLDSPPASPAPQRRSPNERRASSGSLSGSEARSPERPQTPDSGPESPRNSSPLSPQNSGPASPRNSAPSSPRSSENRSPKSNNRSRKSRSSSSDKSRSPSSNSERRSSPISDDRRPRSPSSDKEGPRSPSSDKDGPQSPVSDKGRPRTPSSDKEGPRSPSSDKDGPRSPSSDKDRPRSPSPDSVSKRSPSRRSRSPGKRSVAHSRSRNINIRKRRNTPPESSDSDTTPVRNSYHSESDDDRSSGDYRHRRKNNRDSSASSDDSRHKSSRNTDKIPKNQGKDLDLSDVSDIDSLGPVSDEEAKIKDKKTGKDDGEKADLGMIDDSEQLDFEAEETDKVENGELTTAASAADKTKEQEDKEREDLEEGELSDEGEARPEETEPRPVCRFFSRGQCTWGSSCRFVHPGVTDKGNYTMFEMVRPLVPMNAGGPMMHGGPPHGPPHHHMYPPHMDPYMRPPHIERPPPPMMPPPYQHQQPAPRKEADQSSESAWERGLRQAKEMIRKSSKRKETDADFEEKKMTMSGGGEGVDKENEFYSQTPHGGTSSPYEEEHYSRYNKVEERRLSREGYRERAYGDYGSSWPGYEEEESPPHHRQQPSHRYPRHHHQGGGRDHHRMEYDYYEEREERERERDRDHRDRERRKESRPERTTRKSRSYRDKQSPRDSAAHDKHPSAYILSPSEVPDKRRYERSRGSNKASKRGDDDWADPWMRSKSPGRKTRKPSYSSKSSYSSSSSSRNSSYSSYSRSDSRSSGSNSSRSRSRSISAQRRGRKRKPSVRTKSPFSRGSDKRSSDVERSLHMNPPAPSPSAANLYSRLSPTERRDRKELNARLLAAAIRKKRASSVSSSSGSDSSGSSDDSSSSMSDSHSSSSSRSPSPPPPSASHKSSRKKVVMDEKLAQAMKVKAMDALKLSGQKQQIKLNLKGKDSLSERLQQMPVSSSRKRVAESLPFDDGSPPNVKMSKKAVPPSRREELIKQLKAVEDAIARKRSKI